MKSQVCCQNSLLSLTRVISEQFSKHGSPFLLLVCVLALLKISSFYYFVAQCHVNQKENEKKGSMFCIMGH